MQRALAQVLESLQILASLQVAVSQGADTAYQALTSRQALMVSNKAEQLQKCQAPEQLLTAPCRDSGERLQQLMVV